MSDWNARRGAQMGLRVAALHTRTEPPLYPIQMKPLGETCMHTTAASLR